MALREYHCTGCGRVFDELFDKEYPKTLKCKCGGTAEYRIGGFGFSFGFWDGWDSGAGQSFDTARQRDSYLDKHNLEKAPEGAFEVPYKG